MSIYSSVALGEVCSHEGVDGYVYDEERPSL